MLRSLSPSGRRRKQGSCSCGGRDGSWELQGNSVSSRFNTFRRDSASVSDQKEVGQIPVVTRILEPGELPPFSEVAPVGSPTAFLEAVNETPLAISERPIKGIFW